MSNHSLQGGKPLKRPRVQPLTADCEADGDELFFTPEGF